MGRGGVARGRGGGAGASRAAHRTAFSILTCLMASIFAFIASLYSGEKIEVSFCTMTMAVQPLAMSARTYSVASAERILILPT